MKPPAPWTKAPTALLLDPTVSDAAVRTWLVVAMLEFRAKGPTTAGQPAIAALRGQSERAVRRHLAELRAAGWLHMRQRQRGDTACLSTTTPQARLDFASERPDLASLTIPERPDLAYQTPPEWPDLAADVVQREGNYLESPTLRIAQTPHDAADNDLKALMDQGMSPLEALKELGRWHPVEPTLQQEATL